MIFILYYKKINNILNYNKYLNKYLLKTFLYFLIIYLI